MNTQIKKYLLPIGIAVSVIVFLVVTYVLVQPIVSDFITTKQAKESAEVEEKQLAEEDKRLQEESNKEAIRLKSLKQIYETNLKSSVANLGIFGTMFEEIIDRVQYSGLMIRSIEYDLKPETDMIYQKFEAKYNVCELKFFLVGTYSQLQAFLVDLNNTFPYLLTISKIDVEAFSNNTDYILIDLSINLYSKKK